MITSIINYGEIERKITECESRVDLYLNDNFRSILFSYLDEIITEDTIISLDVFDTFVLRDNSSELSRFIEIGNCMAAEAVRINMAVRTERVRGVDAFIARYLGTKASYRASPRKGGCREGSLTEIHATASRILGLDEMANNFIAVELEYEATRIIPNSMLIEYISRHRARGGRAILVSDMYMHANQIQSLLAHLGIDPGLYDHIFSSADTKVSKASGGIFQLIEGVLSASPREFFHIGDSLKGDYQRPISHGWRAMHLPISAIDLMQRQADHYSSAVMLKNVYDISVDIAVPH